MYMSYRLQLLFRLTYAVPWNHLSELHPGDLYRQLPEVLY